MRYEDASQTGAFQGQGPIANDDLEMVPAGTKNAASGNLITGEGTQSGTAGADSAAGAHITAIAGKGGEDSSFAGGKLSVSGEFGRLSVDADGNYVYVVNQGVENVRDRFSYTLADNAGASDTAALIVEIGKTPVVIKADAQQIVPGPDGVVTLPPGVELSDVHVVGRNLVVDLPDGTQLIIIDGAVFVPQLVLGGVEVPATNVAALLIGQEIQPAAGEIPPSGGGNFALPPPPLDPGIPLGDLLPPTEYDYIPPEPQDTFDDVPDEEPAAGTVAVQLDDDAKAGGIAGGTGDDADSVNATGFLPGSDGDGDLTWDLLDSGAPAGFSYVNGPNGSILVQQVQDGNTVTVLTITIDPATGAYTVVQNAAIRHATGDNENNTIFNIDYTVTDEDGDSATGSMTINVDDDTPTVTVSAGSDSSVLLTTHDALTIGAGQESVSTTANFSGVFSGTSTSPGADGAGGGTVSGYALSTTGGASGLASHGVAINLYNVGGVIVGSTAASAAGITTGNTIFTVSTSNTGVVTLTQFAQIDHTNTDPSPTGFAFEDHGISLADGAITLTRNETVVDRDGDSVTGSASVQIGANLRFLDDGPTIAVADRGEPQLTVDETVLGTNATASFAANFSANFGADGPGSITYALGISAAGANSGLIDVATGQPIVLVLNGGVVEGHVGSAAGALAFTVSVDASGNVTLDQIRALTHPNAANPDDSVTLSADTLVTLTATAHDFDGDTDSETLNIGQNLNFEDDGPSISTSGAEPSLTVDETVLATNASASVAGAFTSAFGADGAGTVTYALGITGGNGVNSGLIDVATGSAIVLVNNAGVIEGHVGNAAGALAFTVNIDAAGNVTLDQIRAVTHPNPANPDDSVTLANDNLVTVTATVTDRDGDTATAVLNFGQNLNFEDDGPAITLSGQEASLTVDETNLAVNATAAFASAFTPVFGADGAGTVGYALSITGGNGVASGLIDVATGQPIVLVNNAGVIEGHVGNAAGALAFTVTVDGSGNVTLDQIRAVQHPNPANPDDSVTLSADNLVVLTATVTDRDGDTANAAVNIGQNLNFEDDGPSISASVEQPSLTVDETVLATNATASFAGVFTPLFGADGAGTVTYALGISAPGANSGLIDVATGSAIVLVNNAGVIEGHVGNAAGALAFTVTVDASGNVTLDQIRAVQHPNPANPDDSVTLSADTLVTLTATVTDRDGDQASATANIGQNLNFEDDGPSISASTTQPTLTVDETVLATNASASFAGVFTPLFGADGAGTVTYALGISAPGANSGLIDVATGSAIVLVNNAGVIEGHVGNAAGALAFTVTVDASGNVTLDQIRAVQHPNPANPDDSVTLSADTLVTLTATVTDRDGDQASATANIGQNLNFEDDGPSITLSGSEASLTVDETNLAANAGPTSFASAFTPAFGADGAAAANSLTYALSITGGNGVASGLIDVATGQPIVLVNNAGVIEGHVGNAAGALAFTVTVDASGNVSLDQIRALSHPNAANPDDSVTLSADNLIVLTATATDRDGDQASVGLNIGQNLNFEDDGPAANNDTDTTNPATDTAVGNVITGVGTTEGAGNADQPGADGFGSITNVVGSSTSDNDPAGGFTAVGTHGTLQMDANGQYTYTRTGGAGGQTDSFTYTYVDRDGDPATATLVITISDQTPVAGTVNVQLDDDALANGIPGGPNGTDDPDAVNVSGNLPGSGGNAPLTWALLTTGAPAGFSYVGGGTSVQVFQGATHVATITLTNPATGAYTVTQVAPIQHAPGADENNVSFTVNYTVTDADLDPANGTIVVNIDDDTPTVVASTTQPQLTVDETVLATNASASFAGVFTNAFGADGPAVAGSVTYALAITGGNGVASGLIDVATGQAIVLVNNAGVIEGHVGNAAGALAFTVTVDAAGVVTLDQIRAVTHPNASNPDDSVTLAADNLVTLSSTITDRDGDTATATANIGQNLNFEDDGPTISPTGVEPQLTVDETVLATNASASFAANFTTAFGADGAGTITYALSITGGNGVASGLIDVATGQSIVLVNNAGVIEGHVGNAAGALAFTVSVAANGTVTLDQIRAVQHPNPANPDDSVTLSADNLVVLTGTITDRDGDQASASINIGQNLNFEDDGPSIGAAGTQPSLTVDETVLATNATADFSGIFTPAFGADGAGTVTYALGITGGNGVDSGLDDVATGQNIVLVNNAGVIEGHVGNAAGALAFTVTVDGSGNVTLDQIRAVTHPNTANPDDSVTLSADNLITLTATVTDRDGDQASATANIGQNLNFEDDGPSATIVETGQGVSVDESVGIQADSNDTTNAAIIALFAGVATPGTDTHLPQYATNASAVVASTGSAYGADGAGTTLFSLNVSAAGVDSGLNTTDGTDIFLYKEGALIVGRAGSQAGPAAFAIAIDPVTGQISMVEYLSIQHPNAANPDDSVSIADGAVQAVVTVTDRDGDAVTSTPTNIGNLISFQDSAPVMTAAQNINIQNSGDVAHTGQFAFNLGADGAATNNNVITNVTFSATVNGAAVTNPLIGETIAETATSVTYGFSFNYVTGPGAPPPTATATGTITFDKVAGTYTVDLANPIQGFTTIVQTATGTLFQGYEFGTSNLDGSQPEISVTQIQGTPGTPLSTDLFLQFTSVAEPSSGTGDDALEVTNWVPGGDNPAPIDSGGDTSWSPGQLFNQDDSWVSTSNDANGVAGDTIQGGEVLDFMIARGPNPTGTLVQPAAFGQASTMFLKFDGIGDGEDFIIVLKLYDPTTNTYSTKALIVENADIQKGPGSGPGIFSSISLDNNDGLIIIEPNDYQGGNTNLVIVGAQIAGSDEGVTGTGLNFNYGGVLGVASTAAQDFSADVNDGPMKISSIGLLSQTTTAQPAQLTFNVTVTDGDGDSITQTVTATISANADSASAATIPAGNTTVSSEPINTKSTATISDSYSPNKLAPTNDNQFGNTGIVAGIVAASGISSVAGAVSPGFESSFDVSVQDTMQVAGLKSVQPAVQDGLTSSLSFGSELSGPAFDMVSLPGSSHSFADFGQAGSSLDAQSFANVSAYQPNFATDQAPAFGGASAFTAAVPTVGMASAEALAAMGSLDGLQQGKSIGHVVADALGLTAAPTVDALLQGLPGGGGMQAGDLVASPGMDQVPGWDMGMFGAFGTGHDMMFVMDALVLHQDAVQPTLNG